MAVTDVHDGSQHRSSIEKHDIEKIEHISGDASPDSHRLQNAEGETVTITWKTWFVIFVLSSTFGLSFWPVPTTAAMMARLAIQFGDPTSSAWYIPAYTTANSIGFLLAGANSDLFGRRWFLLFGNCACCVGFIVIATAKGADQFTAGLGITGFGGGFAQMAMCSIPGKRLQILKSANAVVDSILTETDRAPSKQIPTYWYLSVRWLRLPYRHHRSHRGKSKLPCTWCLHKFFETNHSLSTRLMLVHGNTSTGQVLPPSSSHLQQFSLSTSHPSTPRESHGARPGKASTTLAPLLSYQESVWH